jgi:hypothetical protein
MKHAVSKMNLLPLSSFGAYPIDVQKQIWDSVDPDDEQSVKRAIRTYIEPRISAIDRINPGYRTKIKFALWYFIHRQPWDPALVFSQGDPVFPEPEPAIDYYKWAWDVLFADDAECPPDATADHFDVES